MYSNEKYLLSYPFIDWVIPKVGTFPFLNLLNHLNDENGFDKSNLKGVFWSKEGDIDPLCSYEVRGDDSTPHIMSKQRKLVISRYKDYLDGKIDVVTARGCNGSCSFCSIHKEESRIRTIDKDLVVEEIYDYASNNFKTISIKDENYLFHSNPIRPFYILEKVNEKIKNKYDINIKIKSRIDSIWKENKPRETRKNIELLYDLGVREIQFGVESLKDHIRQLILKGVNISDNMMLDFLRLVTDCGIKVNASFIIGIHTETESYYKTLINEMEKNFSDDKKYKIYMNFITPHPINNKYDYDEKSYFLVNSYLGAFNHKTPILIPHNHGRKLRKSMLSAYDNIREITNSKDFNPEVPIQYREQFKEFQNDKKDKSIEVYNGI